MSITRFNIDEVDSEHQEVMESMIPSPDVADAYVNRFIGGMKDFDLFELAHSMGHNILMGGPTGSGKTTAAAAYASHMKMPYISIEMNSGFDTETAIGRPGIGDDGLPTYLFGEMTLGVMYPSIIDINEIAMGIASEKAMLYGLFDVRQSLSIQELGIRIRKSPGTLITASYNPGYTGVRQMNEAEQNKFGVQLDWGYDHDVETQLVTSGSLLTLIENARQESGIRTDVGTNVMMEFEEFSKAGGIQLAKTLLLNRFTTGEQPIISTALDLNLWNIADELGLDATL